MTLDLLKEPKKKLTLKQINRRHFERRWNERIGFPMNDEVYLELQKIIKKTGFVHECHTQRNGRVRWQIRYKGLGLQIVQDIFTQELISVMEFSRYGVR